MQLNGKSRKDVCQALGFSYYTFSDWVNGKKYPRMDKVEMLADYFGILKSDLIEDKTEMQKKNDAIADIVARLRVDENFLSIMQKLSKLDREQLKSIEGMLSALLK